MAQFERSRRFRPGILTLTRDAGRAGWSWYRVASGFLVKVTLSGLGLPGNRGESHAPSSVGAGVGCRAELRRNHHGSTATTGVARTCATSTA